LFFCNQPKDTPNNKIDPHFSSPESTIQYYWTQLVQHNYNEALKCFVDYPKETYNEEDILPLPDVDSLQIDSIISLKMINKKEAEIRYIISFFSKKQNIKKLFITGDRLILTKKGWKIKDVLLTK
jgi:hypothetical protein